MLSTSPLSSGHAASGYYRSEGYYIAGSPEAEHSAIYHGKGAVDAGLEGRVNDDTFTALLDGQTPDGRVLGRYRGGEREHRAGLDLTFSAPKSVSIAALVGGDTRIIAAHTEAVKTALDYAEAHLIQTRRTVNGELTRETGGKIIAGVFQHDTSRALDPQLHSHAVITNVIKDRAGTYRSMSNEKFFEHGRIDGRVSTTLFLGQLYRNALAEKLEELGYQTEGRDQGLFELKGIPQDLIDQFSKRRQEILDSLKERGMKPNSFNSQLAALATRAAKQPVERAELRAAWDAEVKALGIDLPKVMEEARSNPRSELASDKQTLAARAVDFAVTHHGERNSIYAQSAIVDTAMKFAPTVTEKAIAVEIEVQTAGGTLFTMDRKEGRFLTDVENVRLEKENIRLMQSRKDRNVLDMRSGPERLTRRSSDAVVARKLAKTTLTTGQKDAVARVLSSTSGVIGVQGFAGTGKTYALATAVRMAEARGYTIDGIAPSHKAVSALGEAVQKAATVESTLVRFENGANLGDKSRTILIVDEASMLSSLGMNRVLRMARAAGYARTVLVGDIQQLEAVGAGSAFRALQDAGMPTALMSDIQRQRTEEGRTAVLSAIRGDIAGAMSGIADVSETGGRDRQDIRGRIADKLAETYSAMSRDGRASTGLIVLTNDMRRSVNESIQNNLRLSGEIGGGEVKITSLTPKNFTQAEASEIGSYKVGDIVVAPIAAPRAGLTSNTLYAVAGIDRRDQKLTLSGPDGETVTLDMHWKSRITQKLAAFGEETQTFVEGDRVKFKITDRAHGVVNSAEGTLLRAEQSEITIRTKDGDSLTIPTDSLAAKGMQLGYAATAHDFQGSTVDRVLLGMSSEEQLSTQKAFYVALSRMRDATHLVTDDADRLASRIQRETGARVNALEALAEEKERLRSAPTVRSNEPAKTRFEDAEKAPDEARMRPEKDQDKPKKIDTERDPKNATKDAQDEERQLSLLDTLKTQIEQDQKTRDERSR